MSNPPILVYPTDFSATSEAALPWVRRMAEQLGLRVHCVFVIEEPQPYAALDMAPISLPDPEEIARSGERRLEGFVGEHLAGLAHGVERVVLTGYAASEIVAHAREHAAEMIVMSTHGYSGVRRVLMGSTTNEVLRSAPCAVLSVRNADG